ncbi:MAG: thioredoxin fold domain-containing protein [Ruminococcus sp.]|nr:thioredoxin fold domain-containing protein [Ruminococcus sp.]
MLRINSENFQEEVMECDAQVFVIFSSERCSFCKDLERLTEILQRVLTDVKFCRIDVDKNRELATKYSVSRVPTSVIFKDSQETVRREGALTKAEVYKLLGRKPAVFSI